VTDVIAHRGLHLTERENTVAAFVAAVRAGASGIELDVRRAADSTLVVHHDARLDDGRPVVEVAAPLLPPYVPTLGDALDACAGAWVNVEIKNDPDDPDYDRTPATAAAVLAALLARPEDPRHWLVSSFSRAVIDHIAASSDKPSSRPATAWLTLHRVTPEEIAVLAGQGHAALHPWDPTVDADLVEHCHAAGLRVNVWTVNDPARAAELAAFGVDGICTDDPVAIAAAISTPAGSSALGDDL
jgi:glycerophosphoryl diester phosphodiesterase